MDGGLLLLIIIVYSVLKDTALELPFTLRGKAPPSHERRMEKLRQKRPSTGHGGGRPMPRTGPGRYFSGILDDAIDQARVRRSARHKVRNARRGVRTDHRVNEAANKEKARLARKTDRRTNRQGRWSLVPTRTGGQGDGPVPTDLTAFDKFPETDQAAAPADRPTPRVVPRLVKADPSSEPEEESTGRHAAPAQPEVSNVTSLPVAEKGQPVGGEVPSLNQAIEQAKAWEHVLTTARDNVGIMGHLLKAKKVDGPPLERLTTIWEALSAAAVEMGEVRAALETRLQPQESLTKIEGSPGDTGWLTGQASQAG